jgi:NADPH:quinone reductase-like Zn-dependent oxidoreductase
VKAVVCTRYGPPEVLQITDVATPAPKKDQVCIRIAATAVSSSDCYIRGLKLPIAYRILARLALGVTAPRRRILGMVLAGEVESVGADVRFFGPGDQVFGFNRRVFGTYAEQVCWPQDGLLAERPANMSCEEAAAIPFGGLLAMHYLRKANVRGGQRVLIYGASGAVGTSAVQLARNLGAYVTGVCSSANLELVKSLGAAAVIDYASEDFTSTDERYDVIFDAVGRRKSSKALQASSEALTADGIRVSVDDGTPRLLANDLITLKELAEAGKLVPVIDRRYPLEQIVEAHRYVDGGHKRGNVVVTVGREP